MAVVSCAGQRAVDNMYLEFRKEVGWKIQISMLSVHVCYLKP